MPDKGMSVSEAARQRGVRVEEIYRLIRAGKARASKVAGRWIVYSLPARRSNGRA